ncbi:CASP-like protein [Hordeum vulgare]|nr:CASP-like protein [Hordeum vulgare]
MASSSSKNVVLPAVILALRLLALAGLVASLVFIVTDPQVHSNITLVDDNKPISLRFKDVYTYRYVLAIAVIGCAYSLVQVPLAALTIAAKNKVIGRTANVALFLICIDVIFAIVFATAAGACYGFSHDAKRFVDGVFNDVDRLNLTDTDSIKLHNDLDMFFIRAYVAAGFMLLACKCTAVVIVLSAIALVK